MGFRLRRSDCKASALQIGLRTFEVLEFHKGGVVTDSRVSKVFSSTVRLHMVRLSGSVKNTASTVGYLVRAHMHRTGLPVSSHEGHTVGVLLSSLHDP